MRTRPYSVARITRLRRSRVGALASSANMYAALAMNKSASISSMSSPPERDDSLENGVADRDHHEPEHDQHVTGVRVPERRHVLRTDECERDTEEQGHTDEDV